jgi:hypothetical protein
VKPPHGREQSHRFDTLYDVVKSEATAPPPASRIYGISAVALYEAVAPGARHHRSLAGQLHGLDRVAKPRGSDKKYHWPAVANAALALTIRGLFPSLKPENASPRTRRGIRRNRARRRQSSRRYSGRRRSRTPCMPITT